MADARPPSAGAAAILVAPTAAGSDRLVVMADGRVVAQGDVAAIVGAARVTVVETAGWAGAFEAIERAGKVAGLAGRSLRVPGADPALTREQIRR